MWIVVWTWFVPELTALVTANQVSYVGEARGS
jgi:hypothetical protein